MSASWCGEAVGIVFDKGVEGAKMRLVIWLSLFLAGFVVGENGAGEPEKSGYEQIAWKGAELVGRE